MRRPLTGLLLCGLALVSTACTGTRKLVDPTVVVTTDRGQELGVSTQYGVVFLGRTARSGRVELEAFYGDGPSIERSVIEPVGGGLFTAETEIRLPAVPLTFELPRPGETVVVRGRKDREAWELELPVRADERVWGLLLPVPAELEAAQDQVGAGVYWRNPEDGADLRLIGLVSGRLRLEDAEGEAVEYLAVEGPEHLWRLVSHRRDHNRRKPWVYREDIL